jgi:hypothetical protein
MIICRRRRWYSAPLGKIKICADTDLPHYCAKPCASHPRKPKAGLLWIWIGFVWRVPTFAKDRCVIGFANLGGNLRRRRRRFWLDVDRRFTGVRPLIARHQPVPGVVAVVLVVAPVTGAVAAPMTLPVPLAIAWMTALVCAFCETRTAITATVKMAVIMATKTPTPFPI